jgi:hypothetical protein
MHATASGVPDTVQQYSTVNITVNMRSAAGDAVCMGLPDPCGPDCYPGAAIPTVDDPAFQVGSRYLDNLWFLYFLLLNLLFCVLDWALLPQQVLEAWQSMNSICTAHSALTSRAPGCSW